MERKLAMNCQHFSRVAPRDTKIVYPRTNPFGSYDDDTTALVLALLGLALMTVTTVSMLIAFSIL